VGAATSVLEILTRALGLLLLLLGHRFVEDISVVLLDIMVLVVVDDVFQLQAIFVNSVWIYRGNGFTATHEVFLQNFKLAGKVGFLLLLFLLLLFDDR